MPMAKSFLIKFPPEILESERGRLEWELDNQSFMQLSTYTGAHQVEYLFEGDRYTEESLRETFKIPATCEVIETSNWLH